MTRRYLHLRIYPCGLCAGPVVGGSTAVRENEISKEINVQQVGAICLTCGQRQDNTADPMDVRHLPPISWEPMTGDFPASALVEKFNRAELL